MRAASIAAAAPVGAGGPLAAPPPGDRALAQRALDIYQRAQDALRRGDWAAYGTEQKRLEDTLRELSGVR